MSPSGQQFKVKLASGRILGPLDLERIHLLIVKGWISGTEVAREYPDGEWRDINFIPAISELFLQKVEGKLKSRPSRRTPSDPEAGGATHILPGATQVLGTTASLAPLPELETMTEGLSTSAEPVALEEKDEEGEKTAVMSAEERAALDGDKTVVASRAQLEAPSQTAESAAFDFRSLERHSLSQEQTVVFQRNRLGPHTVADKPKSRAFRIVKGLVVAAAIVMIAMEIFGSGGGSSTPLLKQPVIRPRLPQYVEGKVDPEQSAKIYAGALRSYLSDTVTGYRAAVEKFHEAASLDPNNVKALAMLASSYLNLIDSSNKDENYFIVISKLLEMARAKASDLPETVITDVEFYITVNKPEAAQNRIVQYANMHATYGLEMFYYLGLAFYHRGDAAMAARYLAQFPDQKVFSAKIFHLRGLVAEKLLDPESAFKEYEKAVAFNPKHAKSRLRIAELLNRKGDLKSAAKHLEYIVENPLLLSPRDLAASYFLHSALSQMYQKYDIALGDMERAVKLTPGNHEYLMELYLLRSKAGESVKKYRSQARMYYFLSQGEKYVREGKHQEALTEFLQARQANEKSPLPAIKTGDMFMYLHDLVKARLNYQIAAQLAPESIEVWSKYIDVLIQSYEWEEAQAAMSKFRNLPVPQSAIDKSAADLYAKQGRHREAQVYYRKAMARESIDPDVYIAYANSLMATGDYKEAPFFFALALRFDPLNFNAVIGTAKCIANTESIDRAITMLQDELQKTAGVRAELLTAIAELQIQKGAWEPAQENIDQAMAVNPNYAYPWKLQGQIHAAREGTDREALTKALFAYKSYSDRNPSDPEGYFQRYDIFSRLKQYDKASEELNRIFEIYPKYPNLHFFKARLYNLMGNQALAVKELLVELKNNANNVPALIELGKFYIELRDPTSALPHLSKAMQLAPQNAEAKHYAGYANYLLKNFAGAVALYNAALAFDRGNPLIYKRLGLAHKDLNDNASAAAAFRKYLEMEPDAPDRQIFERFR